MALYQLKIRCEDRNVIAYLSPEVVQTNYYSLLAKVHQVFSSCFRSMTANDFKVEYADDEKTLVELRNDDNSITKLLKVVCLIVLFVIVRCRENSDTVLFVYL